MFILSHKSNTVTEEKIILLLYSFPTKYAKTAEYVTKLQDASKTLTQGKGIKGKVVPVLNY
jgi:hypothetical protein